MQSSISRRVANSVMVPATLLALALNGCSSNPSGGGALSSSLGSPYSGPITTVYTRASSGNSSISEYAVSSTGVATPVGTITASSDYSLRSIATDSYGEVYASRYSDASSTVSVYAPGAAGLATPVREIALPAGFIPSFMAVDTKNQLYVSSIATASHTSVPIEVYSATSLGAIEATLTVPTLGAIQDMEVDPSGNLYVTANYSIYIFPGSSSSSPIRTLSPEMAINGAVADATGTIYANATSNAPSNFQAALLTFAPGASGAAIPTNVVNLPVVTANGWVNGGPVHVDSAGNVYTSIAYPAYQPSANDNVVFGYPVTATGNATPTSRFTPAGSYGPDFAAH
jgi:hypothetical protein